MSAAADAALTAVHAGGCTRQWLKRNGAAGERFAAVAVGKCAVAMMGGALSALGDDLIAGLCVTKSEQADDLPQRVTVFQGNHPVPGADSFRAGDAVADFIERQGSQHRMLFLISGGTSALAELPADGVSKDEIIACHRRLLASGEPIGRINAQRSELSAFKAGGAATMCPQGAIGLYVSDVPDDEPATIGSGWLVGDAAEASVVHAVVAHANQALDAVVASSTTPLRHRGRLYGDFNTARDEVAASLGTGKTGWYLWRAEAEVPGRADRGRGGRCHHLALSLAQKIVNEPAVVLCLASDGDDGNTGRPGAMVDGESLGALRAVGVSVQAFLTAQDSASALDRIGASLPPRETHTNVSDLIMAIRYESGQ